MIFFIITILLLPIYYRSKLLGWMTVIVITAISLAITIWLVLLHDLSIKYDDYHYQEYSMYAYSKPYCRIPAYFVGVVAAWILEEMENHGFTRSNRPTGTAAQIFATCLFFLAG